MPIKLLLHVNNRKYVLKKIDVLISMKRQYIFDSAWAVSWIYYASDSVSGVARKKRSFLSIRYIYLFIHRLLLVSREDFI